MKILTLDILKTEFQYWLDNCNYGIQGRLFTEEFVPVLEQNDFNALKPFINCVDLSQDRFLFHQMVQNYMCYKSALKFGFTDYIFDQYGWLRNTEWQDIKEYVFKSSSSSFLMNSVKVGKGKNDQFAIGVYWGTPFSGGCSGLSISDKAFNSFDEALISALQELIRRLSNENEYKDNKEIKVIISQAEYKLKELTKIDRNNQTSLF